MASPVKPFELLLFTMAAVTVLSPPAGALPQGGANSGDTNLEEKKKQIEEQAETAQKAAEEKKEQIEELKKQIEELRVAEQKAAKKAEVGNDEETMNPIQ